MEERGQCGVMGQGKSAGMKKVYQYNTIKLYCPRREICLQRL